MFSQFKCFFYVVIFGLCLVACEETSPSGSSEPIDNEVAVDDETEDTRIDFLLTGSADAEELGVMPGDTVCLDASVNYDKPLLWENFIGSEAQPIIITNCNGLVHINPASSSYGWKFKNSKHFKILGNGDDDYAYGIKISTQTGFYLTMEYFTTNFEIAYLEIAGVGGNTAEDEEDINGFAGIGIKTSPYQDCDLFQDETKTAFVMEDVSIHDNYIHGVGGEGIYAGHGFYQGRQESRCPDGVITYAHNIHYLSIYNNYISDVGYDGIQIKNADQGALVYGNVVRNYGMEGEGAHDEGIFIGDGFEGIVHSNWVENGPGHGFQVNAFGDTQIYNNVVLNSGSDGFYINNSSDSFANRDGTFGIYHNTLINMGDDGIEAYLGDGQSLELENNVFVDYADDANQGFTLITASNIFSQDITWLDFIDVDNNDYGLNSGSIAINIGTILDLTTDYSGVERSDGLPDAGAFEYASSSSYPDIVE